MRTHPKPLSWCYSCAHAPTTQTIDLVRVDPKLIAKAKKAERRAAASRLLEPMHVKKPPVGARPGAGGAVGAAGAAAEEDKDAAAKDAAAKPRTPEEYEAWRCGGGPGVAGPCLWGRCV